ncbi:MAG: lipid-A-disaccharide synthase [Acidobacteriaceae bacterium]
MSDPLIFISAGEASGERYGALLIDAVRKRLPGANFFGLGGTAMEAAGCERVVRAEDIAVMGITEVLLHMPRIYSEYRRLVRSIRSRKPDVAVLIDFPDVNFRLARELKKLGVPVIYFVSPQLWAWKKHRIRWVRDRVTKMLVIFPFEETYYRERGVNAEFVGHPLADLPQPSISRAEFAHRHGLNPSKEWVGLLPGSRAREIKLNLPAMAAAANLLGKQYDYVLPAAATLDPEWIRKVVAESVAAQRGVHVPVHVVEDARGVFRHARASIVASGTATVEAALIGNPFIAVYRLSRLSYAVASRLVRLPHVAMVNLIAGARIVPELIQEDFTPENIARVLRPLLEEGAARENMMAALASVRNALRADESSAAQSAIDRAAAWVLRLMHSPDLNPKPAEILPHSRV